MKFQYLPGARTSNSEIYSEENNPLLGIDFGTTNSVVSQFIHAPHFHGPKVYVHSDTGDTLFPSYVLYNDDKKNFISGSLAFKRRLITPEKIVSSIKRHLDEKIALLGDIYPPQKIVEEILSGLIQTVKDSTPYASPQNVTITVPYHFLQPQNYIIREATENAFRRVFGSYPTINIIPEPVAASLYWIYKNFISKNTISNTLVFDIGGGTFDLSLIHTIVSPNRLSCEIIATDGCENLGGADIDQLLFDFIIDSHCIQLDRLDAKGRKRFVSELMDAVINTKHELSIREESNIVLSVPSKLGFDNIDCVVSRSDLERLMYTDTNIHDSIMNRIEGCVQHLLSRESVKNLNIDYVVLVGGPTRMPIIKEFVLSTFKTSSVVSLDDCNDDYLSVSKGACIYSALTSDNGYSPFGDNIAEIVYKTRIPHSIYIEKFDKTLDKIINEGLVCPAVNSRVYYPTKMSLDSKTIILNSINIYQCRGGGEPVKVGKIDFSQIKIYSHGRKLSEIPIKISVIADSTLIRFEVVVSKSSYDNKDLKFTDYIKM